jgi:hypothetical protein
MPIYYQCSLCKQLVTRNMRQQHAKSKHAGAGIAVKFDEIYVSELTEGGTNS